MGGTLSMRDVKVPCLTQHVGCAYNPKEKESRRDMDSKQTVLALYSAYASGDAERISALLDDEVRWVAPAGNATQVALGLGRPHDAGAPCGANDLDRDAIVTFMAFN